MEGEDSQSGVVGVGQGVDERVYRVAPHNFVVQPGRLDEPWILRRREERVWEISKEVLEEGGDGSDIIVEDGRIAEVDRVRI